jgi:predicted RNase H-like nuclease (RuvC/YqgF family)
MDRRAMIEVLNAVDSWWIGRPVDCSYDPHCALEKRMVNRLYFLLDKLKNLHGDCENQKDMIRALKDVNSDLERENEALKMQLQETKQEWATEAAAWAHRFDE